MTQNFLFRVREYTVNLLAIDMDNCLAFASVGFHVNLRPQL